jgi:hypothetical protein
MLCNARTYEDFVAALHSGCECHGEADHELDANCRCEVCYSNMMDVLSDRERDRQMEREWAKHPNR